MPFSGGNYSLPAGNPVVSGTTVSSTVQNNTMTDIATALSTTLCKDGQSTPSANLPMAGFKFTGLGPGAAAGDSLRWQQLFSQGTETDIASAASMDIGGQNTNFLRVTGTATVASFGTNYNGPRFLRFADAVTLTYNSSSLILPGASSITATAGDTCIVVPKATTGIADGWVVVAYERSAGGSKLLGAQIFATAGTYTYTPTAGTTSVVVEVQGGGGGSGGCVATAVGQWSAGRPGAGGGWGLKRITSGFSGATVTVGAGGVAGVAGDNSGGAGGTSSFAALLSCTGGAGGGGSGGVQTAAGIAGGLGSAVASGGTATGADVGITGDPASVCFALAAGQVLRGAGGGSRYGAGGSAAGLGSNNFAGPQGTGYGSGAAGPVNSNGVLSALAGTVGQPGIVIVWEYA